MCRAFIPFPGSPLETFPLRGDHSSPLFRTQSLCAPAPQRVQPFCFFKPCSFSSTLLRPNFDYLGRRMRSRSATPKKTGSTFISRVFRVSPMSPLPPSIPFSPPRAFRSSIKIRKTAVSRSNFSIFPVSNGLSVRWPAPKFPPCPFESSDSLKE